MQYNLIIAVVAGIACLCANAADTRTPGSGTKGFVVWTAKELREQEAPLHKAIGSPTKNANIKFEDYGESATQIGRREGRGLAEYHEHLDDYFVVQSGQATLVIGGEIVNPRPTDPGEIRGDSISGGEQRKLATGDIVHIPSKLPHWLIVEDGKHFTYFVIKVKVP